jgi:dephospho-CoA kinase
MPVAAHPPQVWIVTGGIACGKSTAVGLLRGALPQAAFFDADAVVADLLRDAGVLGLLAEGFGRAILDAAGGIDRTTLRERILSDPAAKRALEAILHPRVRAAFSGELARCQAAETGLLVADVPLYYETGGQYPADRVVVVAVSAASQRQRLRARSGWPAAAIDRILSDQWPILTKVAAAEAVWWNEGPVEVLERQIHRSCSAWGGAGAAS